MNRKLAVVLVLAMLYFCLTVLKPLHALGSDEPDITAKGAVLYEQNSGQFLFEKNSASQRHPASTTKVLSAVLVLELVSLDEEMSISENAAGTSGSSIYLSKGEVFSVRDLLLGTLIKSGNDAAVALAESTAGSEELFIDLMNRKAVLIGAFDSNFANPNGLPDKTHYSSPKDLVLITDYAMDIPTFREIVKIKSTKIPSSGSETWTRTLNNTNRLLHEYPDTTGVKTGTTNAAGSCLIGSVERNGRSFISVVLKSADRYGDTKKLFEYAFNEFENFSLPKGAKVGTLYLPEGKPYTVDVILNEELNYSADKDTLPKIERRLVLKDTEPPISEGEDLGYFEVSSDGDIIERITVTASKNSEPTKFSEKLKNFLKE